MITRSPRHPLVRGYLRDLDMALAALPPLQAGELRQQISTHLAEALPRRATSHDVATVLSRLGAPSELAADAAEGARPQPTGAIVLRRLGARIRRAGWQAWVLSCVFALVVGGASTYLVAFFTAPLIQFGDGTGWYYGVDVTRAVDSEADIASQTTAPIRSGKRQGLIVNIYNPSDFTETVLGLAPGGSPFGTPLQLLVSEPDPEVDAGGMVRNVQYTLPETIPPHQYRQVLVKWTSAVCLAKGRQVGISQIRLRVAMSFFTWTDVIPLNQGFYISGPSQGPCRSTR